MGLIKRTKTYVFMLRKKLVLVNLSALIATLSLLAFDVSFANSGVAISEKIKVIDYNPETFELKISGVDDAYCANPLRAKLLGTRQTGDTELRVITLGGTGFCMNGFESSLPFDMSIDVRTLGVRTTIKTKLVFIEKTSGEELFELDIVPSANFNEGMNELENEVDSNALTILDGRMAKLENLGYVLQSESGLLYKVRSTFDLSKYLGFKVRLQVLDQSFELSPILKDNTSVVEGSEKQSEQQLPEVFALVIKAISR